MNGASQCINLRLARLLNRIKSISNTFQRIEFFHILHELNDKADQDANKSMAIGRNELSVNQQISSTHPP